MSEKLDADWWQYAQTVSSNHLPTLVCPHCGELYGRAGARQHVRATFGLMYAYKRKRREAQRRKQPFRMEDVFAKGVYDI